MTPGLTTPIWELASDVYLRVCVCGQHGVVRSVYRHLLGARNGTYSRASMIVRAYVPMQILST
jgi:hypothetical protein